MRYEMVIAATFLGLVFTHPELAVPWPTWVNYILFVLYAVYTIIIFWMSKYKEASWIVCVILAIQFIALGLIMISIGSHVEVGESNWYLPAGLFLTCIANFTNLYRIKRY